MRFNKNLLAAGVDFSPVIAPILEVINALLWDYVNPETLFNTLKESGVLDDDYKYKVFCAFLEVRCFDDFEEKVKSRGDRWDDDVNLWSGYSWEDYGKEIVECCGYKIPDSLEDFIDYERYGKYCGDYTVQEYSDGLIEIL